MVNPDPPDRWFVLSARYQLEVCREAAANVGWGTRPSVGYWLGCVPVSGQSPFHTPVIHIQAAHLTVFEQKVCTFLHLRCWEQNRLRILIVSSAYVRLQVAVSQNEIPSLSSLVSPEMTNNVNAGFIMPDWSIGCYPVVTEHLFFILVIAQVNDHWTAEQVVWYISYHFLLGITCGHV